MQCRSFLWSFAPVDWPSPFSPKQPCPRYQVDHTKSVKSFHLTPFGNFVHCPGVPRGPFYLPPREWTCLIDRIAANYDHPEGLTIVLITVSWNLISCIKIFVPLSISCY